MRKQIKKIIPSRLLKYLFRALTFIDSYLITLFAKAPFFSSVYYCFFSREFDREHQAVLQGRVQYRHGLIQSGRSSVLLRRNIHRLEKGLIMQPRKPVFALDYIEETVKCFVLCSQNQLNHSKLELKWAADVLHRYFLDVTLSQELMAFKVEFESVFSSQDDSDFSHSPFLAGERIKSDVDFKQLESLFKQRRSVRWYQERTVDLNLLNRAVDIASQAPSACNRQPFSFYTITDPSLAQEVSSIAMGTAGFSKNIQALIVVMGDLSAYPFERDRHVIYIDGGLVSMQLMLALEVLGLSSCPINWPDIRFYEKKLRQKLNYPIFQRPIMMLAVGYALNEGGVPYSQKKTASELVKVVTK